jgi:hypothetical protein
MFDFFFFLVMFKQKPEKYWFECFIYAFYPSIWHNLLNNAKGQLTCNVEQWIWSFFCFVFWINLLFIRGLRLTIEKIQIRAMKVWLLHFCLSLFRLNCWRNEEIETIFFNCHWSSEFGGYFSGGLEMIGNFLDTFFDIKKVACNGVFFLFDLFKKLWQPKEYFTPKCGQQTWKGLNIWSFH